MNDPWGFPNVEPINEISNQKVNPPLGFGPDSSVGRSRRFEQRERVNELLTAFDRRRQKLESDAILFELVQERLLGSPQVVIPAPDASRMKRAQWLRVRRMSMRTAKLLSIMTVILLLMAAGGDYAPARPEAGPRGDFGPAPWVNAPQLSLLGLGREELRTA